MKTTLLFLAFLCIAILCEAQTKLIAHKSHSGSSQNFSKAYENNLFGMNSSNFGLAGNYSVYVIDTIRAIDDSTTVISIGKSAVCYPMGSKQKSLDKIDFIFTDETVVNHPTLYKNNTVELIKATGKGGYPIWFSHSVDEIIFIGFKE